MEIKLTPPETSFSQTPFLFRAALFLLFYASIVANEEQQELLLPFLLLNPFLQAQPFSYPPAARRSPTFPAQQFLSSRAGSVLFVRVLN